MCALVLSALSGGFLPGLVRLAGGPPPHVCHCELRGGHSTCACPRCNPEFRDDDGQTHDAVHSTCGDADEATLGKAWLAVIPAPHVARRVFETEVPCPRESERMPGSVSRAPPTPPPETILV